MSLFLFGSVARNEAKASSDVDLLVEFSQPVGLFTLARLQIYLEKLLGCAIDLGTLDLCAGFSNKGSKACLLVLQIGMNL